MGPQRLAPMVTQALDLLQVHGPVALITAGWQEREPEDDELKQALGPRPGMNLMLHQRGDTILAEDRELFDSHRAKQDRLRQLQELYRRRLTHVMTAARLMQSFDGDTDLAAPELLARHLASAIEDVRRLDDEHAQQVHAIEAEFEAEFRPFERPAVIRQRREVLSLLAGCSAVAIAGGHVAVLLNKLRLFGLEGVLSQVPLVAWSAGAMVLTERIVLFHDSPPQGQGDAELLGDGLGLFPGIVVLPHARRRLFLDNTRRISIFVRRFGPSLCVALDERCYIAHHPGRDAGEWQASPETRTLTVHGTCVPMEAA